MKSNTRVLTIPAPIGGWNTRDPIDDMPLEDARELVNWFPDTANAKFRGGYRLYSKNLGGSVRSMFEYSGTDGTRKIIAAANGHLWDASTYNVNATSLASGLTSDYWQGVNFRGATTSYLILVNGADAPKAYNGTAVISPTYTANGMGEPALTPSDLINIAAYKRRLYFCEKDASFVRYGPLNSYQGDLKSFDFGSLFERGGYPLWCADWSRDQGNGAVDAFVVMSSMGEALVYTGDSPDDTAWTLIMRIFLPIPLGRKSFFRYGPDIIAITQDGAFPLSSFMQQGAPTTDTTQLTAKIKPTFGAVAAWAKNNLSWQGVVYPQGHYLLINIPLVTGQTYEQYVMNTITGAWCRFKGMNGASWSLFKEGLYFGGADGNVYQADYGESDNGAVMQTEWKGAFTYTKDGAVRKKVEMIKPIITSDTPLRFFIAVDVDFEEKVLTDTETILGKNGAQWDVSPWDTTPWGSQGLFTHDWQSVGGIGIAIAPHLKADVRNVALSLSAVTVMYRPGGIL